MTGLAVARLMAPVGVVAFPGVRDFYDPATRRIHLCPRTAGGTDMKAHACAAHEAAHAVQHITLRRSFRVWRSWPVQSPAPSIALIAATLAAVLLNFHQWTVAICSALLALARVSVVLWLEWEASETAICWLRLKGLEKPETEAFLRRQWRTYLRLAVGL